MKPKGELVRRSHENLEKAPLLRPRLGPARGSRRRVRGRLRTGEEARRRIRTPAAGCERPRGRRARAVGRGGPPDGAPRQGGHRLLLPQDETPGCTKEACAFRDAWKQLEKADIAVVGVSSNSAERHKEFQAKHQLPFPLASDDSGEIGAAYGVSKKLWGYDRVTFLVDRNGKVAHVWPSVDPGIHANEVMAEAARLP